MKVWDIRPPKTWKWTDQDFHMNRFFNEGKINRAVIVDHGNSETYNLILFDKKKPTHTREITENIRK